MSYDGDSRVPIRFAPTGHVLVQPRINGKEMSWFIFDTGAGQSGVDTGTAVEHKLPQLGETVISSMFGISSTPVYGADDFQLGAVHLSKPTLASMDMAPLEQFFGEPLGGIVGYDVLSRCIAEIDLADGFLRLHVLEVLREGRRDRARERRDGARVRERLLLDALDPVAQGVLDAGRQPVSKGPLGAVLELPQAAEVHLVVYDLFGRAVKTLVEAPADSDRGSTRVGSRVPPR